MIGRLHKKWHEHLRWVTSTYRSGEERVSGVVYQIYEDEDDQPFAWVSKNPSIVEVLRIPHEYLGDEYAWAVSATDSVVDFYPELDGEYYAAGTEKTLKKAFQKASEHTKQLQNQYRIFQPTGSYHGKPDPEQACYRA